MPYLRLSYRGTDGSPEEVAQWFGTQLTDELELVETVRRTVVDSKVSFKIMSAPTTSGTGRFAYLTIRGTTNQWGRSLLPILSNLGVA
jgi:hypothetical protein